MPLKNFIKENFVLVVGLALPVLLVVLFLVASVLPKAMVAPPQYEMLFTETRYLPDPPYYIVFFIKDGTLKASVTNSKKYGRGVGWTSLMAYDGKTQRVREISYDTSKIGDIQDSTIIVFNEFKNMKVDGSKKSPDGYEFESIPYTDKNEIAADHQTTCVSQIVKDAVAFKIPVDGNCENGANYFGYDVRFLGWIIKK